MAVDGESRHLYAGKHLSSAAVVDTDVVVTAVADVTTVSVFTAVVAIVVATTAVVAAGAFSYQQMISSQSLRVLKFGLFRVELNRKRKVKK